MSKNELINLVRHPPDEAILVELPGVRVRVSKWGLLPILALLAWMQPGDLTGILSAISAGW